MTSLESLLTISFYYQSEINKICHDTEFKHSIRLFPTEESEANKNEKLYKLIMYKKNIDEIIQKINYNG